MRTVDLGFTATSTSRKPYKVVLNVRYNGVTVLHELLVMGQEKQTKAFTDIAVANQFALGKRQSLEKEGGWTVSSHGQQAVSSVLA